MQNQLSWYFYPKEHFTVEYQGERRGIGAHPGFDIPGVWNLYCLVSDKLDSLVDFEGDPGEYPIATELIAACIGTAYQIVPGYGTTTVGELATTLLPSKFLDAVEGFPRLIVRRLMGETAWKETTTRRAKAMTKVGANVIYAEFGRKTQ